MRFRNELPVETLEEPNVWIPMPDGARLAARIWRPVDSDSEPVPAVLEYVPYRKRFGTASRDEGIHPYLAGHGYAAVRVDLRGSGESDGILRDEYLPQELDDGLEIIDWLANQPWCDTNVGMMGISWGGFNALQIAALRPSHLKAIVTCSSTDDRYADDVHHMGGCLLGDNLSWASVMFAYNTLPPDPVLVGGRWREMWLERLEENQPWLETWLSHQCRDDYWSHGSVCEDYLAIECPVYAVSGWADGYSNTVFRLIANLDVPRRGLIGPWAHRYPHLGEPGPAIGFLQDLVRWWDQWLKGVDTGIADEPMLRVWMQDSVPPTTSYEYRPGRWVAEQNWPSPRIEMRELGLTDAGELIDGHGTGPGTVEIMSPLTVGLFAGKWCSYASGPDLAHDQRQEDGGALVFESQPLSVGAEILGAPTVELEVEADRPVAQVAVRLSDVAPSGEATRVTYGLMNLTHRTGSEQPRALEPGRRYVVSVPMNHVAHAFAAGHRIRLSVSTSYWPLAWPPPEPARLTIHVSGSRLIVPFRPPDPTDQDLPAFEEPEGSPPASKTVIESEQHNWLVHRDLASDESVLEVLDDRGVYRLDDIDLTVGAAGRERYSSVGGDFGSIRGEARWERTLARGGWQIRTITRTVLTSTPDEFHLDADLDAYEGDERIFCRTWHRIIPRDCM